MKLVVLVIIVTSSFLWIFTINVGLRNPEYSQNLQRYTGGLIRIEEVKVFLFQSGKYCIIEKDCALDSPKGIFLIPYFISTLFYCVYLEKCIINSYSVE